MNRVRDDTNSKTAKQGDDEHVECEVEVNMTMGDIFQKTRQEEAAVMEGGKRIFAHRAHNTLAVDDEQTAQRGAVHRVRGVLHQHTWVDG